MTAATADQAVILWYMQGCTTSHFNVCRKDDEQQTEYRQRTYTQTFSNNLVSLTNSRISELIIPAPAINRLSRLHTIHLQNNNLTSLPVEIWSLAGLQELNVGYNKIRQLPPEIKLAQSLQELFLHNNLLTELPSQIGSLHHLRVLDVTANQLSTIPAQVRNLHLSHFWIEHNRFSISRYQNGTTDGQPTREAPQPDRVAPDSTRILSLFSICSQIIGNNMQGTGMKILYQLPSTVEYQLQKCMRLGLVCPTCNSLIYHHGLHVIGQAKIAGKVVPVSYHCCSQTCLSKWLKRGQTENLEDSALYVDPSVDNQIHSHRASLQLRTASEHDTPALERSRTL